MGASNYGCKLLFPVMLLLAAPGLIGCGQAVMAMKLDDFEAKFEQRLQVVTEALPPAKAQVAYQAQIDVKGGKPPYRWEIVEGQLPHGLSLDPETGRISGVAKAKEKRMAVIQVRDASNDHAHGALTRSFIVNVE